MIDRLTDPQIQTALADLDGWTHNKNKNALEKSFKFKNFTKAWKFMNSVAKIAEDMDHHPEWSNIYNRVNIALTTHDANGISERDTKTAKAIEEILQKTF